MLEKLQQAEEKYFHLEASLSDPAVAADPARCAEIAKEYKALSPIIEKYRSLKGAMTRVDEAHTMLADADDDFRALVNEELREAKELVEQLKSSESISFHRIKTPFIWV